MEERVDSGRGPKSADVAPLSGPAARRSDSRLRHRRSHERQRLAGHHPRDRVRRPDPVRVCGRNGLLRSLDGRGTADGPRNGDGPRRRRSERGPRFRRDALGQPHPGAGHESAARRELHGDPVTQGIAIKPVEPRRPCQRNKSRPVVPIDPQALLGFRERRDVPEPRALRRLARVGHATHHGYLHDLGVMGHPDPIGHMSDGVSSVWWPSLYSYAPFQTAVAGYWDNATLSSPVPAAAVFDARSGQLLYVYNSYGFFGPDDQPSSTFQPYATGVRIDLTSAAIVGYAIVNGPSFAVGSLRMDLSQAVPAGQYGAFLELYDSAGY